MRHPDPSDLLDHRKGELPEEQAREIEFHLELCDECRSEWDAIGNLERRLDDWQPVDTGGEFADEIIRRLDQEEVIPTGNDSAIGRAATLPGWFRRIALATAAVAATLLFQAMVWNPLGEAIPFRAIISLTSPAYAMSTGQAVPDTILVLTVHHDKTMSTRVIPGRHEIKDLVDELIALLQPGQYAEILVVGDDPENPVSISTSDLDPLTEALEISTVRFGEGIIAIERIRNEILARIQVPVHTILREQVVRPALSDSLRRTAVALGNILPIIISTPDTLLSGVFEIRMTPQRLRIHPRIRVDVLPQIEIAQPILTQLIRERVIEALYDSLAVPIRAVLTVNEAGLVLLNRAAVPVDEVEDALRRLKERNPKITLLILIPEDGGEGDSVYLLVKIANKLGIEEITIKKVKRDDPPIPR